MWAWVALRDPVRLDAGEHLQLRRVAEVGALEVRMKRHPSVRRIWRRRPAAAASTSPTVSQNSSELVELILPGALTTISDEAFSCCSGLIELSLQDSLTEIGGFAFNGCSGLVELSLPHSFAEIGGLVFAGCSGLVELNLPHLLTSVGSHACGNCKNLRIQILPPALAWLHATAFEGSMAALRMLVVPAAVRVEVATTMAAMLDPTVQPNRASHDRKVLAGFGSSPQIVSSHPFQTPWWSAWVECLLR
jgi:hypothetical protein